MTKDSLKPSPRISWLQPTTLTLNSCNFTICIPFYFYLLSFSQNITLLSSLTTLFTPIFLSLLHSNFIKHIHHFKYVVIMVGSPAVEIDFFRLKDEPSPKKLSERRDIQGVISKINPELLKTAIASASANKTFVLSGQQSQTLPVYKQDSGSVQMAKSTAPLTIFYNGSVSVFDVSPDQAEKIMKLATESGSASSGSKMLVESVKTLSNIQNPLGVVLARSDLPMSRKKSLRRFLQKRKERQVFVSPYAFSQGSESSH